MGSVIIPRSAGKKVLFRGLCGYLGLAEWHWRIIGNVPLPEEKTELTEEEQFEMLMHKYVECMAPMGNAPERLEEELRKHRCIRNRR